MAYELTIDRTYPEARTYRGRAECFVADLKGPPEPGKACDPKRAGLRLLSSPHIGHR